MPLEPKPTHQAAVPREFDLELRDDYEPSAKETMGTARDFIFWAPKSLQMVTTAMKLKDACSLEERL